MFVLFFAFLDVEVFWMEFGWNFNGKFSFVSFPAHPTFISEVRGILRRIDSLLDALAERRAIPGSSYHARCEEIFKLHYLDDSVQDSAGG